MECNKAEHVIQPRMALSAALHTPLRLFGIQPASREGVAAREEKGMHPILLPGGNARLGCCRAATPATPWYAPSSRNTCGLGWRIQCGVEVTESGNNEQNIIKHRIWAE